MKEQVEEAVKQQEATVEAANSDRAGNKYQWADVISNDNSVLDVYVVGDEIRVVYQVHPNLDLEWVGEYLSGKGYAHERSDLVYQGVQQDTYVDQQ